MEENKREYSEYQIGNTPYYIYVFQDVRLIVLADESKEYGEREVVEWTYPHNINEETFDKDYFIINEIIYLIEEYEDLSYRQVNQIYDFINNEAY